MSSELDAAIIRAVRIARLLSILAIASLERPQTHPVRAMSTYVVPAFRHDEGMGHCLPIHYHRALRWPRNGGFRRGGLLFGGAVLWTLDVATFIRGDPRRQCLRSGRLTRLQVGIAIRRHAADSHSVDYRNAKRRRQSSLTTIQIDA